MLYLRRSLLRGCSLQLPGLEQAINLPSQKTIAIHDFILVIETLLQDLVAEAAVFMLHRVVGSILSPASSKTSGFECR